MIVTKACLVKIGEKIGLVKDREVLRMPVLESQLYYQDSSNNELDVMFDQMGVGIQPESVKAYMTEDFMVVLGKGDVEENPRVIWRDFEQVVQEALGLCPRDISIAPEFYGEIKKNYTYLVGVHY